MICISSGTAFVGMQGRVAYSAAKAGLLGMVRVLAVELAPLGVRVNAIAPGYTKTPMVERAIREGLPIEDTVHRQVPMGRMAEPNEIASVVRFVASNDASYMTGQCLVVDGGWTVQGMPKE